MKTQTTFQNGSLVSVVNGTIVVKSAAGIEHTFTNASVISINNGIITIESEWIPKKGELVKVQHTGINCYVIFNRVEESSLFAFGSKEIHGCYYKLENDEWMISAHTAFSPVTPEEQQAFDDFCKSQGKIWNKEKLQWEKYRWKPLYNERYYSVNISSVFLVGDYIWRGDSADRDHYRRNNCFKTVEEAEAKLEQIRQILNQ